MTKNSLLPTFPRREKEPQDGESIISHEMEGGLTEKGLNDFDIKLRTLIFSRNKQGLK